jgi:DNA oxidative demethylase
MEEKTIIYEKHKSGELCVTYDEKFLSPKFINKLYSELTNELHKFKRDELTIYGRKVLSPRLVHAYGEENVTYKYSGVTREANTDIPQYLLKCKEMIEEKIGNQYNFALVNYYVNGDDYIGWHSDNEKDIDQSVPISSISIGAERDFYLKNKASGSITPVLLSSGSLLIMGGETQKYYVHSLPKRKKITEPRFNITFRKIHK